jgi:hypothetical protein
VTCKLALATFAAFAPSVGAQTPRFVYPSSPASVTVRRDVGAMDIYRPVRRAKGERLPVAILFAAFGGAEMRHNVQFSGWGEASAAHGLVTLVAEDIDSALVYLGRHADELGADPERVAVVAWSAHAAAGLPLIEDPRRQAIKAAMIYYGAPRHHGFDLLDDNAASREIIDRTIAYMRSTLSDSVQAALRAGLAIAEAAGAASRGDYAEAVSRYAAVAAAQPTDASIQLLLRCAASAHRSRQTARTRRQCRRSPCSSTPLE